MKTLLLIRHAKSSWANIGEQDFDRPLNERGFIDAENIAQKLLKNNIEIDTFVTSAAKRALTTCKIFAAAYLKNEGEIITTQKLYQATPNIFYEVINELDNSMNSVAIFAHNPGISEMASMLIYSVIPIDMPTCAVYAVQAETKDWKAFETATKKILCYYYPKEI